MPISQERFLLLLEEAEAWRTYAISLQSTVDALGGTFPQRPSEEAIISERQHFNKNARRNLKERQRLRAKRGGLDLEYPHPEPQPQDILSRETAEAMGSFTKEELDEMFPLGAPYTGDAGPGTPTSDE